MMKHENREEMYGSHEENELCHRRILMQHRQW